MKAGDLVSVLERYHWGGIKNNKDSGILIKRTYTAYSRQDSSWLVLLSGKTQVIKERNLCVV